MSTMTASPTISVVVPTRNRPDHAVACATTLLRAPPLRGAGGFLALVVTAQSDRAETQAALERLGDPRLRHVRSPLRGATNGRNAGIAASRGSVLAFTDDDCRVASDWAASIASIFRTDPEAAVVCGRVRVPEEIRRRGFAMGFEPCVREWKGRFPPPDRDWGITANLAARRDVLERVGWFDPVLGPGAPLLCGEEPDLLFRVLKAGYKVVNASEVVVDHLRAPAPPPPP